MRTLSPLWHPPHLWASVAAVICLAMTPNLAHTQQGKETPRSDTSKDQIEALFHAYFHANSWQERLLYIHNPTSLQACLESHYQNSTFEHVNVYPRTTERTFGRLERGEIGMVSTSYDGENEREHVYFVIGTADGPKILWEESLLRPCNLKASARKVYLTPSEHYAHAFKQGHFTHFSFRVLDPSGEEQREQYIYIAKETDLGRATQSYVEHAGEGAILMATLQLKEIPKTNAETGKAVDTITFLAVSATSFGHFQGKDARLADFDLEKGLAFPIKGSDDVPVRPLKIKGARPIGLTAKQAAIADAKARTMKAQLSTICALDEVIEDFGNIRSSMTNNQIRQLKIRARALTYASRIDSLCHFVKLRIYPKKQGDLPPIIERKIANDLYSWTREEKEKFLEYIHDYVGSNSYRDIVEFFELMELYHLG